MTREEAIKKIKKAMPTMWKDTKEAIQTLIPELAESEDERIRMALVEYFAPPVPFTAVRGMPIQKIRDWLEKQKHLYETTKDRFYREGFEEGQLYEKQKEQKPSIFPPGLGEVRWNPISSAEWSYPYGRNETADRLVSLAECLEMDGDYLFNGYSGTECGKFLRELARKQLECKPEEWGEEDKKLIDDVINSLCCYQNTLSDYQKEIVGEEIRKLKLLKPQLKQEWSEEDDMFMDELESYILYDKEFNNEQKSWRIKRLKSLRPQSKQEWQIKKGDKVSIHCRKDREKDIIAIYDGKVGKVTHVSDKRYPWGHIDVKLDNGCNNSFHEDELEVLDEPHWKPSDEQMSALEECGECKRCVKELREQIKKL